MAAALPWVEILRGVFLILGLFVRVAGEASLRLLLTFLAALAQVKARGLQIECGADLLPADADLDRRVVVLALLLRHSGLAVSAKVAWVEV